MTPETAPVEGYAAIFGAPDLNGDIIASGAFAKTLKMRETPVRMLYQHDSAAPIGRWTALRVDARGLYATGEILLDSARGREAHALIAGGALDGLSIGYKTRRAAARPGRSGRTILEAELWEISVVTFPMAPGARIRRVPADTHFARLAGSFPPRPGDARDPQASDDGSASAPASGRAFGTPPLNARHFADALKDAASILSV